MDYAQAIGILANALDTAISQARQDGLTDSEIAGELQVTIDGLGDE